MVIGIAVVVIAVIITIVVVVVAAVVVTVATAVVVVVVVVVVVGGGGGGGGGGVIYIVLGTLRCFQISFQKAESGVPTAEVNSFLCHRKDNHAIHNYVTGRMSNFH